MAEPKGDRRHRAASSSTAIGPGFYAAAMRAVGAWVIAGVLLALGAARASAHQLPPTPQRIVLEGDRIVLSASFGLVVSDDAGASWRWVCAAAYGADPTRLEPDVVIAGDASVVLGDFDGAWRAEPALCDFAAAAGAANDTYVTDLAIEPGDADTVWGLSSSGFGPDWILRSEDDGRSWAKVGEPVRGVRLERIALAPSDPSRVYASGARPPSGGAPRQAFVLRSDDRGEHLTRVEIPLLEGELVPLVVGVDPRDAERVFVRMARDEADARPERMLVSEDGGQTFASVIELPAMRGFAMSDDGRTIWIGSALGGLWVAQGGALEFEEIAGVEVRCLAFHESELFVCADPQTTDFALGRSEDGGVTLAPLLRMEEVRELRECPHCSHVGALCPAWVPDLLADYERYFGEGDAGPATFVTHDASLPAECTESAGGCACRAAAARSGARPWWLALLALLALRRGSR